MWKRIGAALLCLFLLPLLACGKTQNTANANHRIWLTYELHTEDDVYEESEAGSVPDGTDETAESTGESSGAENTESGADSGEGLTETETQTEAETEAQTEAPAVTEAQTEESTDSVVYVERGPDT